jgi:arabinogalactan endo-1,4-beta-galactosidase
MRFIAGIMLAAVFAAPAAARAFYFGADLSYANEMNDCGAVYRDNGAPKDVYAIFKDHGANLVRVRLWNDATWTKYGNLSDVERSIRRAKAQGLRVLLDFHYSDDWADAGKQVVPAAWAAITDENKLAQTLYQYTFDTLTTLDKEGLMPDLVQVGNEINSEILMPAPWTKGQTINWERNARLINAAIKAVRDAGTHSAIHPKVMLHIAQPENVEAWFAAAVAAGVTDFDVIGISYYSKWSKFSFAGLGGVINRVRHRYNKDVLVAETAYPWTLQWADNSTNLLGEDSLIAGYSATPDGQASYLTDLTQAVIDGGGAGVIYWAPDWVSTDCRTRWGRGSNWENATLFDFHGDVLPGIDFMRHTYQWPVSVTFRFHGLMPPPGQPFYLWGDFLGSNTFAVRLPDDGTPLTYTTTIMPGQKIRFQVFDGLSLHTRLLAGDKVVAGFANETVPSSDTVFDYDLTKPAQ